MSHPNRSRRQNVPGRAPQPEEVRELRTQMGLNQTQFAKLLYYSQQAVAAWEATGKDRRLMPGAIWEYANLLHAAPEVRRARDRWLTGAKE